MYPPFCWCEDLKSIYQRVVLGDLVALISASAVFSVSIFTMFSLLI